MLKKEYLKRKLTKYAKTKEQKYQPKTREEVLAAVEVMESIIRGEPNDFRWSYLHYLLGILCERTRTLLNMEPPEGMEWRLVEKPKPKICCETCAFFSTPLYEKPCDRCRFMIDEKMSFRNWSPKNDT